MNTSIQQRAPMADEGVRNFVRVESLCKSFGATAALKGVSFDVEQGSTVSLLGPSGCGKTTVLRSIAGLERPDSGRIAIGGEPVYDGARSLNQPPERRQIGMVFQSYAVWPHMSVAQNVGFPLKVRKAGAAQLAERVTKALELVGLQGLGERPATNLSGGQQQRVALARAIVHEPRLVLFDEPLSNLDARLRQQMRTELKLLQDRLGFTAIYVTHDQEEALALSTKVIVMNDGQVEAIAQPRALFAQPATAFVAHFLGFDNIFDGTVAAVGARDAGGAATVRVDLGVGTWLQCAWRRAEPPLVGAPVTVAFRSERAALASAPTAPRPAANVFCGTIEAAVYLGISIDYLVKCGSLTLRVLAPGECPLTAGAAVSVSVTAEDCIVFPRA
ncbi:MAG: ABC transporter ATP-binding protein [Burkholderiales bacterium]|nr:ABC transporter ATP-binding protein [Burkholderiales bacterium]